ncbi:MAG: hypothetical protein GQ570_13500 [Helicobacteraceae bacterium]|nr:hypothetical protein [Helicobacteraceae bacterium]
MEFASVVSLFLLGLSYGSTACMFTCMPFLSPLILTNSNTIAQSMRVLIPFSVGRVVAYTSIAIASFYSAVWIKSIINNEQISQTLLGTVTIAIGSYIIFKSYRSSSCSSVNTQNSSSVVGYFLIGFAISLNPCVPVMTLVSLSLNATSVFNSATFGLTFGLGAVSASFLIFGVILSKMAKGVAEEFSKYKTVIEKLAGAMLIVVGISTLNGWISL